MEHQPRPLGEQVIVITGPTSGIGLATARRAWEEGARVVLVSRNEGALRELSKQFGERCTYAVADMADASRVEAAAEAAVREFGRIDSWINNAGVSIYGRLTQILIEDHKRLFETNFWGVVNGSLTAVRHMRQSGGALINVGSVLSDRALLLQGMYSASKHAVKAFTDALRMELEEEAAPISVTLIKPASINTPYVDHARNYTGKRATLPPPVYSPNLVAEAILHVCEHPRRELIVGGGGKAVSLSALAPRIADKLMERTMHRAQTSDEPPSSGDGLYESASTLAEDGSYRGHVMQSSAYTRASLYKPLLMAGALMLGGVAIVRERIRHPAGERPHLF